MTWSFQENKNPCKEGFLPMSVGNACRGAGVCTPLQSAKLTHQSGKRSTSYRVTRPGPTLATGRTQPTVIQGKRPDQARRRNG